MISKEMLHTLEGQNKSLMIFAGVLLILAIGFFDFLTGYELAFSLFYLLPISLLTWLAAKRFATIISFLSALVWLAADLFAGQSYTNPGIFIWNTGIRFGFFTIIVWLIASLKKILEHERELARLDPLTGAVNSRFFQELLKAEIERLRRYGHPFTVIYTDVDDFKEVNDRFGHGLGDQVLCEIVRYSKEHLRQTDRVARLGGDEFMYLLPETGPEAAPKVIKKIQDGLLGEMQANHWDITFSMGALTCTDVLDGSDQIISIADHLMYAVKQSGKNSVNYDVYARERIAEFQHFRTIETRAKNHG